MPFPAGAPSTSDRLVVAGPSAIASTLAFFVGRTDLSWPNQVTVVATASAPRQLAALGSAIVNATQPTRLVACNCAGELVGRPVISEDAAPDDANTARRGAP